MNFLSYKGLKQQNICTTFVFRPKIYGLFLHLFRFLFCSVLTYSYLCNRTSEYTSVEAGVTFVGII